MGFWRASSSLQRGGTPRGMSVNDKRTLYVGGLEESKQVIEEQRPLQPQACDRCDALSVVDDDGDRGDPPYQ